jgi:type VI secretion system protein VasL
VALYPANHSYERLSQQLIDLEQRLLDAEHKRTPYMTISALKTHVYQMRETLKMQEALLENQLNQLQVQRNDQQPVSPAVIQALELQLEALQYRVLLLSR